MREYFRLVKLNYKSLCKEGVNLLLTMPLYMLLSLFLALLDLADEDIGGKRIIK